MLTQNLLIDKHFLGGICKNVVWNSLMKDNIIMLLYCHVPKQHI